MSSANPNTVAYSADVRMRLSLNGHVFNIAQLGPDFIILREKVEHPPAEAQITLSIDGREDHWRVHLPHGISAGELRTPISSCVPKTISA